MGRYRLPAKRLVERIDDSVLSSLNPVFTLVRTSGIPDPRHLQLLQMPCEGARTSPSSMTRADLGSSELRLRRGVFAANKRAASSIFF